MSTLNKTLLSVALTFAFVGSAFAQEMNPEAKESYSLGASVGHHLSSQIYRQSELGAPVDVDKVVEGFMDALKNKSKLTDEQLLDVLNKRAEKLNELYETKLAQVKQTNAKEGQAYLDKNKAKKQVIVTASGLQVENVVVGKGPSPKEEDVVTMEYSGHLVNGTPFTTRDGKPVEERSVVMTLIPGFQEGLKQMKEGEKSIFTIPAKLAYGEEGAGPVPPESVLIFEVTLKKVEKPGAGKKEGANAMPAGHPKVDQDRPQKMWPHS